MKLPVAGVTLSAAAAAALAGSGVAAFSPAYQTLRDANILDGVEPGQNSLVVLVPQLGEFDSSEYCEFLTASAGRLGESGIALRVVGIGDEDAADRFCSYTGLDRSALTADPGASLHRDLGLYDGPDIGVPDWVSDRTLCFLLGTLPGGAPDDGDMVRPVAAGWLRYLAMCAGIGAPGTLKEILRGYFGDYEAPERFSKEGVVEAGPISIGPGVGPVRVGPFSYTQWFADETGYQRPVELATVRLKHMVEVLTNWDLYVTNPLTIAQRGGTFLFDGEGEVLYEHRSKGVLTYSETMPRPLTFLSDYIGKEFSRNPLGLPDTGSGPRSGRGVLKPAGKAMGLLGLIFAQENRLQARALGVEDADLMDAKAEIKRTIEDNKVVIYTYGLSPFSTESLALLEEMLVDYTKEEIGLEWFLLGKEASAKRAALLEMTGQSSLPHVFINGKHIGGLFTGPPEGSATGGLAGLKESGELETMVEAGVN